MVDIRRNYFRAVRNDLSTTKRVTSYLAAASIIGVGAGAVMLLPAVGALIAAPTAMTALAYSSNLAGAAILGGTPMAAHLTALHRDNKLAKAEKSIHKATNLQIKILERARTDGQLARWTSKRDKKLDRFNRVYEMYEKKTLKLAHQLEANFDVASGDLTETRTDKNWNYYRKLKKLKKVSKAYRDLDIDKRDYEAINAGLNGGDTATLEDYKLNMQERRMRARAGRGLHRVGAGARSIGSRVYGATRRAASRLRHIVTPRTTPGATPRPTPTDYTPANPNGLSIFEQLRLARMTMGTDLITTQHNSEYHILQPRIINRHFARKNTYLDRMQEESVIENPHAIHPEVSVEDFVNYYTGTSDETKAFDIADSIREAEHRYNRVSNYMDTKSAECKTSNKIFIQLDYDKPNFVVYKEFDDIQKALAYTRCLQGQASKNMETNKCDAFRMTMWQKQDDKTYLPLQNGCATVTNQAELTNMQDNLLKNYLYEMRTLHLKNYVENGVITSDSTLEIVKKIEELSGCGHKSIDEIKALYNDIPNDIIESLMPDATESERIAKLEEFNREQFEKTEHTAVR